MAQFTVNRRSSVRATQFRVKWDLKYVPGSTNARR
jgi:hypothetical protein